MNTLAEKRTQGNQSSVPNNPMTNDPSQLNSLDADKLQQELDANAIAIESKKFPSLAYLRKMGVNSFKPSIHHKVQSGHKVFNILNDPVIATVSPRIECTWEGGQSPKWTKSSNNFGRKG